MGYSRTPSALRPVVSCPSRRVSVLMLSRDTLRGLVFLATIVCSCC